MGDIIDKANDTANLFLEAALSQREQEAPPSIGFCHFCRELIDRPKRWCDADCREDWEKEQWAKRNAPVYDDET